jgi:cell division protein ZapB
MSPYSTCDLGLGEKPLEIKDLEAKIDELIQLCDELEKKHALVQADRESLMSERTRLLEKNEMARNKVEAMIMRLKALEQD